MLGPTIELMVITALAAFVLHQLGRWARKPQERSAWK